MKHTEFWSVLERVFPDGLGESLARDLALPELDSRTAVEALNDQIPPASVWSAICAQMDLPERFTYLHKIDPRDDA